MMYVCNECGERTSTNEMSGLGLRGSCRACGSDKIEPKIEVEKVAPLPSRDVLIKAAMQGLAASGKYEDLDSLALDSIRLADYVIWYIQEGKRYE